MRLKFDRLINLKLMNESVRVPNDELWKITMYMSPNNRLKIEEIPLDYNPNILTGFISSGTTMTAYTGVPQIRGIAFKVVKEE